MPESMAISLVLPGIRVVDGHVNTSFTVLKVQCV